MAKSCLILDTYTGGLELDIREVFKVQYFETLDFKPGRLRIGIFLFFNRYRIIKNYTHLSCGGFWQLFWAQVILKDLIIVVPGIDPRYHKVYSLLIKFFRSSRIYTCDIEFHRKYGANLYTNYKRVNLEVDSSKVKTIDVLLVGRNDKNKRFAEFVDLLIERIRRPLSVVHLGSPPLEMDGVESLGQVDNNDIDNYFRQARTLVISSLYESSPRVIGEALRNGVPCAMTCVGNLPYIFDLECCEGLDELIQRVNVLLEMTESERLNVWKKQVNLLNAFVDDCSYPISL